jgi:dCMP deaminase
MKRDQSWWDLWFITLAAHVATASKDRTQAGAVIAARDHSILAVGYNGYPRGFADIFAGLSNEERYARMIHAEVNALLFAGKLPPGATLYTTPLPPCDRCAAMMIQAGLRRFVTVPPTPDHRERWNIKRTEEFMEEVGAELIYLEP